jgi:glycosyltransferase involved in cell wall biosynthesis
MPALSIITVNRNNADGLKKTMLSVLHQTFTDYEYIIIDGASNDKSIDIIKEISTTGTYWVSEPDSGIYNAMNKGLKKAEGDYCLFLNSGDYLNNDNVLADVFEQSIKEDLIIGSVLLDTGEKKELFEIPDIDKLTFRHFINSTFPHPGVFIRQSLFNKIGGFNEELVISSDLEFFLVAVFKYGVTIRKVKNTISVFELNGISSLPENTLLIQNERTGILKKHFPFILPDYQYLDFLEQENMRLEKKVHQSFWFILTRIGKKILKTT